MPKLSIIKELGFFLISVLVCAFFGIIRVGGIIFVVFYMLVYVTYIVVTIVVEKKN